MLIWVIVRPCLFSSAWAIRSSVHSLPIRVCMCSDIDSAMVVVLITRICLHIFIIIIIIIIILWLNMYMCVCDHPTASDLHVYVDLSAETEARVLKICNRALANSQDRDLVSSLFQSETVWSRIKSVPTTIYHWIFYIHIFEPNDRTIFGNVAAQISTRIACVTVNLK